jgi:hypothetical protein
MRAATHGGYTKMAQRRGGAVYLKSGGIQLRKAEFEVLMRDILEDIAHEASREFEHQVLSKGIKLTGELANSFRTFNLQMVEQMGGFVEFNFKQYGRFKDMRYVEYRSMWIAPTNTGKSYDTKNAYPDDDLPDSVAAMMKFIEETGIHKFKYIPGYDPSKSSPVTSRAIKRLAWTLAASRMRLDRVRNKRNNDWYTKGLMAIRKRVVPEVQLAVAQWLVNGTYSTEWADV